MSKEDKLNALFLLMVVEFNQKKRDKTKEEVFKFVEDFLFNEDVELHSKEIDYLQNALWNWVKRIN